jgi:hypothetical protein
MMGIATKSDEGPISQLHPSYDASPRDRLMMGIATKSDQCPISQLYPSYGLGPEYRMTRFPKML